MGALWTKGLASMPVTPLYGLVSTLRKPYENRYSIKMTSVYIQEMLMNTLNSKGSKREKKFSVMS